MDLGSGAGWSGSAILCSKFSKIIATILFAFNLERCFAPDLIFIIKTRSSCELRIVSFISVTKCIHIT